MTDYTTAVIREGEEVRSLESVGLPRYFVTSHGMLLSDRGVHNQVIFRDAPLHEIASKPRTAGYRSALLRHSDGSLRHRYVHELVGLIFLGEPPEWHEQFRHLDNDKLNCHVSNIAFGTCQDNAADRKKHGTHKVGSQVKNSRLTEDIVRQIRRRTSSGESCRGIAIELGVSRSTIEMACGFSKTRKTWTHVQ